MASDTENILGTIPECGGRVAKGAGVRSNLKVALSAIVPAVLSVILNACGGDRGVAAPVAVAVASTSQGTAPLSVNFDASQSTDPQGLALTFAWVFSDGSTGAGASISHTFQTHGSYAARVAVANGLNTTTSAPISITVAPAAPTVQTTALPLNVLGVAQTKASAQVAATDRENLTLAYALAIPPMVGTATVDPASGIITYAVPGYVTASSDTFTVTVSNLGASATGKVNVAFNSDPLLPNQWHIQNVGQDAFASTLPVSGNDMNVAGAWAAGYSGKGIKVGVVDTGLEVLHEDLAANVDLTHSYNFLTKTNDPSLSGVGFDHGTAVAGIIGAVAFNGKGGRGVAYHATLRGYNFLAVDTMEALAMSLGSDPISSDNDLFNASFGDDAAALPPFLRTYEAITDATLSMRGGLGASIVVAAGNDFSNLRFVPDSSCDQARHYKVSCGDTSNSEFRGSDALIIVGAINAQGVHSSYSNMGSALWVTAPGGEYGFNSTYAAGYPTYVYEPAIVTTSRTGCANSDYDHPVNALDSMGANPFAANCQYTALMNGTSAATPNAAAVVALILEANPDLSVRDIKFILAKTATHIDPGFAGVSATDIIEGSTIVLEQGWVTNAAGFSFSNRYGFGAVNAAAAVASAKAYTSYLPTLLHSTGSYQFTPRSATPVPPASVSGLSIAYNVSETFNTAEFVDLFVNLASTPGLSCNQIELTSPSGTKSIVLHALTGLTNAAVVGSRFESNAFYGEPVNGLWVLRFLDFCTAKATATVLPASAPQTLRFAGH